jgi:proteasome lid subunit RPN8/RPN11
VILPEAVAAAMVAHACEAAPVECCGLLIGDDDRVTRAIRARNIAADPTRRYLVDPRDHLAAIRDARAAGRQVIGAYHSHPHSAPIPSSTDEAEGFAHFVFLIVGLAGASPELRAWTWVNGNFAVVPLVRVP